MAGLIVVDASVLIAHQDPADSHHDRALWTLAAHAGRPFGASPLTVAEILVEHVTRGNVAAAGRWLKGLGVEEVPFGLDASMRLAALRARTRLKLPDCCVLLAAQDAGADTIATFDDRLAAAGRQLGVSVA
ncbi:MAG: type II toxin-antitoxin system VapC family toxin [Actinomycetota bacterium]|nr:type II toxin-antitoxin system VapC family toxin [Actinomycetota bacterium]